MVSSSFQKVGCNVEELHEINNKRFVNNVINLVLFQRDLFWNSIY